MQQSAEFSGPSNPLRETTARDGSKLGREARKPGLLPLVKVPQTSEGGDGPLSRKKRSTAVSYRPALATQKLAMSTYGGEISYIEPVRQSRNTVPIQNRSLNGSFHVRPTAQNASSFLPLNKGVNKGKFNQLKSLLQNSERVQTGDQAS